MNEESKIKHYIFPKEDIDKIKSFCRQQFLPININNLFNNLMFMRNEISSLLMAAIARNYNQASFNGIIYPKFIFPMGYSYPTNYNQFLCELKKTIYTIYQIAKQAKDAYVWAYFLIIAAECKYTIEWDNSINIEKIISIIEKLMCIPNLSKKIIETFYKEEMDNEFIEALKLIKNKITKMVNAKVGGVSTIFYPIEGSNVWHYFLASKNKQIAQKNSFIYKLTKIKKQEIKNKVLNSFNYITQRFNFVFPYIFTNNEDMYNYHLFKFLVTHLISLSKTKTSFSKFLTLKIKKGCDILVGDLVKLCNELKI